MTIVVISAGAEKASKTNAAATLLAGPLDPNTPWLKVDGKSWIDGDLYGLKSAGERAVRYTRSLLKQINVVVIVLSNRMLRYLRDNDFELPGTQLIPNGVDLKRFQPIEFDPDDKERQHTVICVSKLRYEKGIDVLLQAWKIVQEQLPEARLVIVGTGPLHEQIMKLAAALEVTETVEFAGLQSDVPGQLHRGTIAVLPSRWEGMPNALLESMACGNACVATRVSGSEDVIQHGENGLLVATEDYTGLAQALLTLLRDPELTRIYGDKSHNLIKQQYTLEHVLKMYTDIYDRLTSSDGRMPEDISSAEIGSLVP